jgi:hypothetical protein
MDLDETEPFRSFYNKYGWYISIIIFLIMCYPLWLDQPNVNKYNELINIIEIENNKIPIQCQQYYYNNTELVMKTCFFVADKQKCDWCPFKKIPIPKYYSNIQLVSACILVVLIFNLYIHFNTYREAIAYGEILPQWWIIKQIFEKEIKKHRQMEKEQEELEEIQELQYNEDSDSNNDNDSDINSDSNSYIHDNNDMYNYLIRIQEEQEHQRTLDDEGDTIMTSDEDDNSENNENFIS